MGARKLAAKQTRRRGEGLKLRGTVLASIWKFDVILDKSEHHRTVLVGESSSYIFFISVHFSCLAELPSVLGHCCLGDSNGATCKELQCWYVHAAAWCK